MRYSVAFSSNTDQTQCDAIRAALDAVLGTDTPQAIDQTPFPSGEGWGEASKLLRNGQLLILRGDKTYTLTGAEIQ